MRIFVNALSLGSLSGRYVLFGHLRELARQAAGAHEFWVLHQPGSPPEEIEGLPGVRPLAAPRAATHWATRSAWEAWRLPTLLARERCEVYFTPAGTVLPKCSIPQVSLAQNPWCLTSGMARSGSEKLKSRLQRASYRRAFRHAALMAYNSQHMRTLYRANAPGVREGDWVIAHQGIDDSTHDAAAAAFDQEVERTSNSILCVSVMAHWKGADVAVRALGRLRDQGVDAQLQLVGPWADADYRRQVESLIGQLNVRNRVEITGQVSRDELHQRYAKARVFCLMSRCESFGIPAVEAQAFGAPVVGSSVCAMAEIGGLGGEFFQPTDLEGVTQALSRLLTDQDYWAEMSQRARANAARYRWSECSRPLMKMFGLSTPTSLRVAADHRAPVRSVVAKAPSAGGRRP